MMESPRFKADLRPRAATRRRALAVGKTVLVAAFFAVTAQAIARAQVPHLGGRPAQGNPGDPHPFDMPGRYAPYPVIDPTAGERAAVAARVYRAVLDDSAQESTPAPRPAQKVPDRDTRSYFERLGAWSLRWQDAQDNASRSLAARYQTLADHLDRMSALEQGRLSREAGPVAGPRRVPKPTPGSTEVARFFRPVGAWEIDRIIPARLQIKRPLSSRAVAITTAEQAEIAARVYRAILDEAVDRFLGSAQGREPRANETALFGAPLAERLATWSELWRQSQDAVDRESSWRVSAIGDRSDRATPVAARTAGAPGHPAQGPVRAHIERMSELETGRFLDDSLKRARRQGSGPIDTTRFPEFVQAARFFRIEAESRLAAASSLKRSDPRFSGQPVAAGRIYTAILDGAARQWRVAPRAGRAPPDIGLVFDARLAERFAAWSIRWAKAQILADQTSDSRFRAVRSHGARMASLEDGRSLGGALERAGPPPDERAAPPPPPEFADVARFFRLEALWELAQMKSR